jgi:hypothetical protein
MAVKTSQRNRDETKRSLIAIFNASRVQPASLAEDSPNDHHQTIAFGIQRFPLLHGEEV